MKKHFLALIGLAGVLAATAGFTMQDAADDKPAKTEVTKAVVGEEAPAFTLKDQEGNEVSLSDYEGKVVVLQWINPDCPVCVRCMKDGTVKEMREALKELDSEFVHLAINTTPSSNSEINAEYLKEHEVDIKALDDHEGVVGKLYQAKTTPHLYVIDSEGVLRYAGAIDNGSGGKKGDTNYAVNAVKQILAGETVSPDETRAYGCKVNYASK